ncbi:MAG TPA: hypothetical protein VEP90_15400 [Methylomirabilota bacterium]|nr:hypothetical protein [Methylomirabilota bacterium]
MTGLGGPTAGGDDALKMLWDLDELKHKYKVVATLTPEAAVVFRKKQKLKKEARLFTPVSQVVVYRTIGRGPRRRIVAMTRRMDWNAKGGGKHHSYKGRSKKMIKPWFGSNPIIAKDEWRKDGHK